MKTPLLMGGFVLTWSSGFVGATWGARAANASTLLAWRYLVASLILTVVVMVRFRRDVTALRGEDVKRSVVAGLLAQGVFLGGVFSAAEAGLSAGVSALICSLQPVVVAFGARLIFGAVLKRQTVFTLCLGLMGVAMCVGPLDGKGLGALWLVVVSLMGLSAAALVEGARPIRVRLTIDLWLQMLTTTVLFVLWAAFSDGLHTRMTPHLVGAIAWLVILSGFAGYASFTACLRRVGPVRTSLLLYLTPAVTLGWAWLMFGQVPSGLQLAGCAVVILGVLATRKA